MSKAVAEKTLVSFHKPSCTTSNTICEQTRLHSPGVILSESNVSPQFLQGLLAKFKVQSVIEGEDELQVAEAFGPAVYIRINTDRHWVVLHTGFETPTLDEEERHILANQLNNNLAMAQFSATDHGISLGYFIYYRGGLSVDQFMAMAQRFGSLTFAALRRYITFEAHTDYEAEARHATLN